MVELDNIPDQSSKKNVIKIERFVNDATLTVTEALQSERGTSGPCGILTSIQ